MNDLKERLRQNALDECDEAIDRIEALEAENRSLREAKEGERRMTDDYLKRAEAAEAKLAVAMKGLNHYAGITGGQVARATLAKIGETDE